MRKRSYRTCSLVLILFTLMITTACSIDEHLGENDEECRVDSYEFPVTMYVRHQLQTTRASYDTERMTLSFNSGDELLVTGVHESAGKFAGKLTWTSGTLFEGIIRTEKAYTGNAYDLLEGAISTGATLLPNDYFQYGYLNISGSGCSTILDLPMMKKAFADTKAHGVEQLSYVHSDNYSHGFLLSPGNAILCCMVHGLSANKKYVFTTTDGMNSPSGTVTTDNNGMASFAVAFAPNGVRDYCIQIGDGTEYLDINIGRKSMESGCIYSVSKNAMEI